MGREKELKAKEAKDAKEKELRAKEAKEKELRAKEAKAKEAKKEKKDKVIESADPIVPENKKEDAPTKTNDEVKDSGSAWKRRQQHRAQRQQASGEKRPA